jgi:hypothetical protein
VTKGEAISAITSIALRLSVRRLQKLYETARAIEAESSHDLDRSTERNVRARKKQAEIEELRTANRIAEAEKLEREPWNETSVATSPLITAGRSEGSDLYHMS